MELSWFSESYLFPPSVRANRVVLLPLWADWRSIRPISLRNSEINMRNEIKNYFVANGTESACGQTALFHLKRYNYQSSLSNKCLFSFKKRVTIRASGDEFLLRVLPWGFGHLAQRRFIDPRSEGQWPRWWAIREQKGRDMSNRSNKRSFRHFPGLTWPQKTEAQRSEWSLLIGEPKVRKKRRDVGAREGRAVWAFHSSSRSLK